MNENEVFHDLIHATALAVKVTTQTSFDCPVWTMAFEFRILRLCKCHGADKGSAVFSPKLSMNRGTAHGHDWRTFVVPIPFYPPELQQCRCLATGDAGRGVESCR